MVELIPIYHHNLIGHEINESLERDMPAIDREVFCKKLHKITEPEESDCADCPYFAGWMQGHGHLCVWDDVPEDTHRIISHDQRNQELYRVSRMIDAGILQKG